MRARPIAAVVAALALVVSVAACAPTVALDPAENAADPACAAETVALSGFTDVAGLAPRETNAQATAAWGDPASVVLRCGVESPAPTATEPCVLVGSVYWLRDGSKAPVYTFTTYGRTPATAVTIDQDVVAPGTVLYAIEPAIAVTKGTRQCTSVEDTLGTSTDAATPSPTSTPSSTPTPTVTPSR